MSGFMAHCLFQDLFLSLGSGARQLGDLAEAVEAEGGADPFQKLRPGEGSLGFS